MSVQNEINRITQNVANTYAVLSALGADMPDEQTSDNLATTAGSAKAVLYAEQTLTEEQQTQARTNIGAVKSWNELADRPVVVEGGDTLTWDGNTEGLDSFVFGGSLAMYRVSNAVPTQNDLSNGCSIVVSGENSDLTAEDWMFTDDGFGFLQPSGMLMIIPTDNYDASNTLGFVAAKAGFYILSTSEISSVTIPGYTGFGKEVLNPEYLPEIPAEKLPKALQFGDYPTGGDTLTWDGNTEGLDSFVFGGSLAMYRVSNAVPTQNDLSNGCSIVVSGENSDLTAEDWMFTDDGFGFLQPSGMLMIIPTDNYDASNTLGFVAAKAGFYILSTSEISSVTIPGYTDFSTTEVVPMNEKYLPDTVVQNGDTELILASSTEGSTKKFKITVSDDGTLTATEVTE